MFPHKYFFFDFKTPTTQPQISRFSLGAAQHSKHVCINLSLSLYRWIKVISEYPHTTTQSPQIALVFRSQHLAHALVKETWEQRKYLYMFHVVSLSLTHSRLSCISCMFFSSYFIIFIGPTTTTKLRELRRRRCCC